MLEPWLTPSLFYQFLGTDTKYGPDIEAIKAKTNDLAQAAMKLGEAMYKAQQGEAQAGAGAGPSSGGAANPGGEKVVDAEFEDVTDKNKKTGSG